jgi:hypothetical protein
VTGHAVVLLLAAAALQPVGAGAAGAKWRDDPIWHDGLAEKAVYEATRTIYGKERTYLARAYTDKERADPKSSVKIEDGSGVEVFKHHWSEIVPTENYDYRFSTMAYVRTDDLSPFKLTASTQEDCGASFKELWRDREHLRWSQSVYFPGSGRSEGEFERHRDTALFDALTLTLRDFPFDAPADLSLRVIPTQKDTHATSFEPVVRTVRCAGKSAQDLPIGKLDAHELDLLTPEGVVEARFWFAADGTAPTLHALVRYEGPGGVTFRLKSLERTAYWKH